MRQSSYPSPPQYPMSLSAYEPGQKQQIAEMGSTFWKVSCSSDSWSQGQSLLGKHLLPQQPLRVPEAPGGGLWNPSESQRRPTRNEGLRWAPSPTGDSRSTSVHLPSELSRRGGMTCLKEMQKILGRRYGFCFKMKSQAVLKGGEKWEVSPSS